MTKKTLFILVFCLSLAMLAACRASETAHLEGTVIKIDGNPQEWAAFPIIHDDPEGDKISIELDISTVKAFANSKEKMMYVLVESYIPIKEFTSLELDLLYKGESYRIAFFPEDESPAVMAHAIGEDQWDQVRDVYGAAISIESAIEFSFPTEQFNELEKLAIDDIRIMNGICCNPYEWYTVDRIGQSAGLDREYAPPE